MPQRDALRQLETQARVYELQGDLMFAGAERVVRAIVDAADEVQIAVLDLRAVDRIALPAARILVRLQDALSEQGKELAVVITRTQATLAAAGGLQLAGLRRFEDIDAAREWCEDRLLIESGLANHELEPVTLGEHGLCVGLDADALAKLQPLLREDHVPAGTMIFRAGDAATEIFLLLAGEVAVSLPGENGARRRLATLPPGSTFGELAVLGEATRTADVTAETDVTVMTLNAAAFVHLEQSEPALKARLLQNMLAGAYEAVARMSRELTALERT
jgi:glutaminase